MAKHKIIVWVLLLSAMSTYAQTPRERYEAFKNQARQQYEDFRSNANRQYAEFVRRAWKQYSVEKTIVVPQEQPAPPVVCPDEERQQERKDEASPFEEIVVVAPPQPQPQPVAPIHPIEPAPQPPSPVPNPIPPIEPKPDPPIPQPVAPKPQPKPVQQAKDSLSIIFYGTRMSYHLAARPQFSLTGKNENAVADAWKELSNGQCDDLLAQCLYLRKRYRLNDWAYIQLLDKLSTKTVGTSGDKATLMMAWLYCQSGYKMRLARSAEHLYMMYACDNVIYHNTYLTLEDGRYYLYRGKDSEEVYVCEVAFPQERTMTLHMSKLPLMDVSLSAPRTLQSKRFPALRVQTTVNRNLMDFYNEYPLGGTDRSFGCQWAMYANTPLDEDVQESLYPQLCNALTGVSTLQAVQMLLDLVQTAFVYEYDDTVWGCDRAFFPDETLYYPYSDCEDRSILFSRLVRDLLGLDVVLIYYPGHIATAIRFEGEQPSGDYFQLDEGRYFVADPTYIGADIGMTMPRYRGVSVKIIRLKK